MGTCAPRTAAENPLFSYFSSKDGTTSSSGDGYITYKLCVSYSATIAENRNDFLSIDV